MSRSIQALVLGAALSLMGPSAMATMVQIGNPDKVISVMQDYGVNVPLLQALDTVVPQEWALHVHAEVPQHIPVSWTIGQDWPSVLNAYAQFSGVSVLVSWKDRTVKLLPDSVAREEQQAQAGIFKSGDTPLPAFSPQTISPPIAQESAPYALTNQSTLPEKPTKANPSDNEGASSVAMSSTSVSYAMTSEVPVKQVSASQTQPQKPIPKKEQTSLSSTSASHDVVERLTYSAALNRFVPVSSEKGADLEVKTSPVELRSTSSLSDVKPIEVNEVKKPEEDKAVEIDRTSVPVAGAQLHYENPVAFSKPQVKELAQAIANRFGTRLLWAAPEEPLLGPITLLGVSAEQDVALLKRALGSFSTMTVEYSEQNNLISIVSKLGYIEPTITMPNTVMVAHSPYLEVKADKTQALHSKAAPVAGDSVAVALAESSVTPVEVKIELESAPVVLAEPIASPSSEATAASASVEIKPVEVAMVEVKTLPAININDLKPTFALTVLKGEPLENALKNFAQSQGFTVDWQVKGGFDAKRTLSFEGKSLAEVLEQVLPPLQISADIYTKDSHIIIRSADAVLDR